MALVQKKPTAALKKSYEKGVNSPSHLDFVPGNLDDILINAELPPEENC